MNYEDIVNQVNQVIYEINFNPIITDKHWTLNSMQ